MIRKALIVVLALAAAGTTVLYIMSLSRQIEWDCDFGQQGWTLMQWTEDGHVIIMYRHNDDRRQYRRAALYSLSLILKDKTFWISFSVGPSVEGTTRFPLWAPFLVFAAYPTIAFVRGPLRRYRLRRRGLCVKCGYDLTGNVSGVCPECAYPVAETASSASVRTVK